GRRGGRHSAGAIGKVPMGHLAGRDAVLSTVGTDGRADLVVEERVTTAREATAVWITWETQPRNRSMARELGVPLYGVDFPGGRLRRQMRAITETVRVLRTARPAVVFAPNPSLVLTYLLLACRPLFGFRLVTDAHYGGVVDVTGSRLVQRLLN